MKTKRILTVIVIVLVLVVGYRFIQLVQRKRAEKNLVVKETVIPVRLTVVQRDRIEAVVNFVGEVRGLNEADVYPKVPGKLIKKMVDEGTEVKTGQTIALLDRDEPAMEYKEVEVAAPIDGVFTGYLVDIGTSLSPQVPLGSVADTRIIKVVVNVAEKDINSIRKNDVAKIKVDTYPGQEFSGLVDMIKTKIDPNTRTAEINIKIDNKDGRLKTGMFAKGRIIEKAYKGVVIPMEAVLKEDDKSFVYVSDGKVAIKRQVVTGLLQNGDVEIISGLKTGERIVVVGQDNLRDGVKVEVGQ